MIGFTVLLSGTTTYLTVRQSMRRNLVGGATASDNPMMQSQKMMAYVAPLFALTGLYWQFGLVMYWLTTNLWTLGQQHYIFSKYPPPAPADRRRPGRRGPGGICRWPGGGAKRAGDGAGTRRDGKPRETGRPALAWGSCLGSVQSRARPEPPPVAGT